LEPALECLNEVHFNLEKLAMNLVAQYCRKFPVIQADIEERVQYILENRREKTRAILQNNLEAEMGYLHTNDNDLFESYPQATDNANPRQALVKDMR